MSDKDDLIVAGVNQKDKGIWRDFYNRYYAALCSYVEKILFLTDAVEDLVQEVFISVWEGKRTFSDSRELTNYLYRACYNNALLYIRNHQIHDSILNGLPQEEDFEDEEMLYALTVKEEAIRQLYFYIEELPAEILELAEQRKQARKDKNFALADELRDKITAMGYTVEETRQGTVIKKK
jgi:RNA polymerase sigma-70 factor (ECF subfamily)